VAVIGGVASCLLLLPSPLPGYRLPAAAPGPADSSSGPARERARS